MLRQHFFSIVWLLPKLLQVVCMCWSMMKSTPLRCPVPTHAPSWQFPGWSWAAKSISTAPSRATQRSLLSRPNLFTVANYTSKSHKRKHYRHDNFGIELILLPHIQGDSGGEAQRHQRGGVPRAGRVEWCVGIHLHQWGDKGGGRHQAPCDQEACAAHWKARTNWI